jgi:integrase
VRREPQRAKPSPLTPESYNWTVKASPKAIRDRTIRATLLDPGICREELCGLRVRQMQSRQIVLHFQVASRPDDHKITEPTACCEIAPEPFA